MKPSLATDFREATSKSGPLAEYLTAASAVDKIQAGRKSRARYLAEHARSVVELGCGTGDMIALLSTDGQWERIVGVDHNVELLDRVAERCTDERVETVRADAASLPFADDEFEAALVERTLQHVEAPARVVSEAARVVRPGGTVLVVEPDWSTLGIDGAGDPGVTESVLGAVSGLIRHPFVGRSLRGLLNRAGLVDVVVDAELHETSDLDAARFFALLDDGVAEVRSAGTLATVELDTWQESLRAAASTGDFSASLALFIAVGRVPAR